MCRRLKGNQPIQVYKEHSLYIRDIQYPRIAFTEHSQANKTLIAATNVSLSALEENLVLSSRFPQVVKLKDELNP